MQRIVIAFLVLTIACGFVMAEGLGIDAGVDFTFEDVTDVGDSAYILKPTVEYTNSFGALDLYIDLEYPIKFGTEDEELYQEPYLEEEVGYNLFFGAASTLSLILNNQNTFYLSPDVGDGNNKFIGTLEPSVKFNQGFNFGDLYAQLGFPIGYLPEADGGDIPIASKLILGFGHSSGFGAEITLNYGLSPDAEYGKTELLLSYERDAIYAELDVVVADKDFNSISITPEFDYSINAITLWASIAFDGIGSDGDIVISPTVGVKYSF
jgi:hypothetical protein